MKFFLALALFIIASVAIVKAATNSPTLELEKKIAYQQGQFGALYDHCGGFDDKGIIGGSIGVWRNETFQGYNGTPLEYAAVEKSFDQAVKDVMQDSNSCNGWIKQAAATWSSIVQLSQYGTPVATVSR